MDFPVDLTEVSAEVLVEEKPPRPQHPNAPEPALIRFISV